MTLTELMQKFRETEEDRKSREKHQGLEMPQDRYLPLANIIAFIVFVIVFALFIAFLFWI